MNPTSEALLERVPESLEQVVLAAAARLHSLSEADAERRRAAGKWSRKEILGHLIDSAANNHQRFVRAQEPDGHMYPPYAQDHWVSVQGYHGAPWGETVDLWRLYNLHLARIIRRIPASRLDTPVRIGEKQVTLGFLIQDYLDHLEHHLRQIEGAG